MTTKREAALKLAFENWLGSQGYDEDGMFGADEMEFAFGAGAEADLAAQDARPAPGLAGALATLRQPHTAQAGTLTARMGAVAEALDTSGEAMGAAVSDFIAKAMDLTDLGRAIAADYDRTHFGANGYVPPLDVRQRLTDALAGLTTVVVRNPDADPSTFDRWQGVLDDPAWLAGVLADALAARDGTR